MKTIEQMYNEAKALVEDRTYQIGEISEKTGLQKTANGWRPPKGNKGNSSPNQSENKKTEKEEKSKWKKTTDYLGRDRISLKTKQGGLVSIYETDNPNQKNNRFRVDTGTHTNTFNTMEEAKAFAEKHYGDTKENGPKENKAEHKPVDNWEETRMASGKIYDTPDKSYRIIERKDIDTGESTFDIRNLKNDRAEDIKGIKSLEEAKAVVEKHYGDTKDSTCRITADTKIRLKK